ncbi:hypothetical protein ACHAP5_010420, partial [Fusarium lateritium]
MLCFIVTNIYIEIPDSQMSAPAQIGAPPSPSKKFLSLEERNGGPVVWREGVQ